MVCKVQSSCLPWPHTLFMGPKAMSLCFKSPIQKTKRFFPIVFQMRELRNPLVVTQLGNGRGSTITRDHLAPSSLPHASSHLRPWEPSSTEPQLPKGSGSVLQISPGLPISWAVGLLGILAEGIYANCRQEEIEAGPGPGVAQALGVAPSSPNECHM